MDENPVCEMCRTAEDISEDATFANARLIAAAPELYEAADHMLVAHESESATHYSAAIEKLRAALAKAVQS